MRFLERKLFLYDPVQAGLKDTQNALNLYAEYVRQYSPRIYPKFFEVDRAQDKVDPLWHMPLTERTVFSRTLDIPVLVQFDKPDWRLTKVGLVPIQNFRFTVANLHLNPLDKIALDEQAIRGIKPIRLDYFPQRGDQIFYIGYRLMITKVVLPPEAYWAQTNVWMGLTCEAAIAPDGDARPIPDQSKPVPAELPGTPAMRDWPGDPPYGKVPHDWP